MKTLQETLSDPAHRSAAIGEEIVAFNVIGRWELSSSELCDCK